MKEDQYDMEIMDYLDGVSKKDSNNVNFIKEATELKQILSDLKDIPLKKVDATIDKKINRLIAEIKNEKQNIVLKMWPYFALAASILIFFFILIRDSNLEGRYQKLQTNTDKLSFIYNLNSEQLSAEDIKWLKNEIQIENNPNIKVTIIDLLANYQSKLDQDFFNALKIETTPTVQMALLNILESSNNVDYKEQLIAISGRKGLDITVRQRAVEILSKQQNLKSKNE